MGNSRSKAKSKDSGGTKGDTGTTAGARGEGEVQTAPSNSTDPDIQDISPTGDTDRADTGEQQADDALVRGTDGGGVGEGGGGGGGEEVGAVGGEGGDGEQCLESGPAAADATEASGCGEGGDGCGEGEELMKDSGREEPSSNGSAFTPAPSVPEPPAPSVPAASPSHPVRQCRLRKWADFNGYGFNLHAEKDKPGQYIGAIDPDSPAEKGGLREGDRIIEVNEENIEGLSHAQVIERVKAGGDRTSLLVVDRLADAHYKDLGQRVSSDPAVMTGVTVIVTPATSKGEEEAITAVVAQAVESTPEPPAPSEEEAVANGHEPEKEEEEEQKEEEEEEEKKEEVVEEQVAVVTSTTFDVTNDVTQADEVTGADEEVKKEEEEEEEGVTGLEDYEQVEVVAASVAVAAYSAPSATQAEDDLGAVSYGMNGGAEVPEPEPEPEPRRVVEPEPAPTPTPTPAPVVAPVTIPLARAQQPEPEPEPAVIRSSVTTSSKAPAPSGPAMGGDLHLFMSAAEMKERLKARKKQDPRFHKTSFEAKSKMFEKM